MPTHVLARTHAHTHTHLIVFPLLTSWKKFEGAPMKELDGSIKRATYEEY
jgi:hypothetical protein